MRALEVPPVLSAVNGLKCPEGPVMYVMYD